MDQSGIREHSDAVPTIVQIRIPDGHERGEVALEFEYRARATPIVALQAEVAHAVATTQHQLSAAGLKSAEGGGTGSLKLNLQALPAGRAEITLTLIGADDVSSAPASVTLIVPASDPTSEPPHLIAAQPFAKDLLRPQRNDRVNLWLTLVYERLATPLSGAYLRVTSPTGEATYAGLPIAASERSGEISVEVYRFSADDPLGVYSFAVTLLDRAGNTSNTVEVAVALVETEGAAGPTITHTPSSAAVGTVVLIDGQGFDAIENTIRVNGWMLPTIAASPTQLAIMVPPLDGPGSISIENRWGYTESAELFTPQPAVQVLPAEFRIHEGGEVQFQATVTGLRATQPIWSVNGVVGGDATLGQIDPMGLYRAPYSGYQDPIIVRAATDDTNEVSGSAQGSLVPRPAGAGPAKVGLLGGIVQAADGSAVITLPPQALREPITLDISRLDTTESDADPDRMCVAAVRLEPGGLVLERATTLQLLLPAFLEPGTTVELGSFDIQSGAYYEIGVSGTVSEFGDTIFFDLPSLYSNIYAFKPRPHLVPTFWPSVSSLSPTVIDEGATAAVLVTGANFVPGLTSVSVVDAATQQVETNINVRTVHVTGDGTKLGVTLKVNVMPQLLQGQLRTYHLQVTTPNGTAFGVFSVLGYAELDVGPGQSFLWDGSLPKLAQVRVQKGGRLVFSASSRMELDIIEKAEINGTVVSDIFPEPGPLPFCGAGGSGGIDGADAGRSGATGCDFGAGAVGAGGSGSSGAGGGPFPHYADNGERGKPAGVGNRPREVVNLNRGSGGGGGGGSGGEGWVFTNPGGSGGRGGVPGGAFRLAAGEQLDSTTGEFFALGGNGSNGEDGDGTFYAHSGGGGGGGGGAGGTILLQGVRATSVRLSALGGQEGVSGGPDPNPWVSSRPPTGLIRIDGKAQSINWNSSTIFFGPDLDYRTNLVVAGTSVTITGYARGALGGSVDLRVEQAGQVKIFSGSPSQPDGFFSIPVTLFDGFSTVQAVIVSNGLQVFSPAIRTRTLLSLQGVVTQFAFACSISPANATVPTERSLKLNVTVTGTTQTAVNWSVDGGSAGGTVDSTGLYRAPCTAPTAPVVVRASSALAPSQSCSRQVTVIPGIVVIANANLGTAADPQKPSANVGQSVMCSIPANVYALTQQGFLPNQTLEYTTWVASTAAPGYTLQAIAVSGNVINVGLGVTTTVPACAYSQQFLRVPGHGCAELQIVPLISSLDTDPSIAPEMIIKGGGFVRGETEVFFGTMKLASSSIISVSCNVIVLGTRPAPGDKVSARTKGGTSNAV